MEENERRSADCDGRQGVFSVENHWLACYNNI